MLVGIVGKPSTGKSTFFMAATSAVVERSPRPFTTIKPNHAVGYVEVECADKDFNKKCNPRTGYCVNSRRFVPVELLDVAGLVPGAHAGKGLGNQFLDDLRQADLLIHIVDASGSTNDMGEKVPSGTTDPCDDVRFLEEELDYWIKGILDRNWVKLSREAKLKKNEEVLGEQFSGLGVARDVVTKILKELGLDGKPLEKWSEEEQMALARKIRKLGKPVIIAANKCDLKIGYENYQKLKKTFPDHLVVACSSEAEITLKNAAKNGFIDYTPGDSTFTVKGKINESQKKALDIVKNVIGKCGDTGVQKCLNAAVFDFLRYIAVFPAPSGKLEDSSGNILPDCLLLPSESTALGLAFAVHTDMGEGFIRAIDLRAKQTVGKEHPLKHRDVIEIVFKKK